jgi:uncharacterized protein
VRFTWDRRKAAENLRKHAIAFPRARRIFDDPYMLSDLDPVDDSGEYRWFGIGEVDGDLVFVVWAWPDAEDDDLVRLISARRATRAEAERYWSNRLR